MQMLCIYEITLLYGVPLSRRRLQCQFFRQILGLTPKEYAVAYRAKRMRNQGQDRVTVKNDLRPCRYMKQERLLTRRLDMPSLPCSLDHRTLVSVTRNETERDGQ